MNDRLRFVVFFALLTFLTAPGSEAAPAKKKSTSKASSSANSSRAAASGRGNRSLQLQRSSVSLPKSAAYTEPAKKRNLEVVKPPKSGTFYESGTKEAEFEKILDEEIKTLYRLSRQNQKSPNRGEIWLRLGERYIEKAKIIAFQAHAEYDRKLKAYHEKKTKVLPKLDLRMAREYNEKAVQLFEWFVKDFPKDPKVDQALFSLGYNHFELGNPSLGERYYTQLVRNYPNSSYIVESHFALGEYYFENEDWKRALEHYTKVVKTKNARLNTFALYKSAWCLYRLGRTKLALQALERVIRQSRIAESGQASFGGRTVSRIRLGQEALKDYVPFYADSQEDVGQAESKFLQLSGNENQAYQMLERLAYIHADNGNRRAAVTLFKRLISRSPLSEKAAEYQHQIVLAYITNDPKTFQKELEVWLENFGPRSLWAKENAGNAKLVEDVARLQETTLRNYVLQHHQTAQNARSPYSQKIADQSYTLYFKYFSDAPKAVEMRFFHAELLFDMEKYEQAAQYYTWVADKDPKGPYREKAIVNALLALEKELPSAKEIDAKRGNSLEKIPLDPPVKRFEQASLRYIQEFPKGDKTNDIKRRLGVIYYGYNHFDEAMALFEQILRDDPASENGEIAGNLILDIYKLRGDMAGLERAGQTFLANPKIANTRFGTQVRGMMERAGYLKAEKTAESGNALQAAKEFEAFAEANRSSDLAVAARYNAAVNYEKAGDSAASIRMHKMVLMSSASNPKIKSAQADSMGALARIYQQTGQLEAAAKQYLAIAAANKDNPKAVNAYYNAGVLFDSLGETNQAVRSYQSYHDLSKRADRVEVIFAQAELFRRNGQAAKASNYYDKYLQSQPRNRSREIEAAFMIADIAAKRGQKSKAKEWYQKTLEMYKASSKKVRDETARFAAESRFVLAQETLAKLNAVKFGTSDKQQAKAAAEVKKLQDTYINEMKEVIRFDNGPYIVAALASTGQMFDSIVNLFEKIPVPAGFKEEEAAQYKQLIQAQINGLKNEAKNSYKAAVEKARELEVYSSWSLIAREGLNAHDGVRKTGEIASESRAADWMGL